MGSEMCIRDSINSNTATRTRQNAVKRFSKPTLSDSKQRSSKYYDWKGVENMTGFLDIKKGYQIGIIAKHSTDLYAISKDLRLSLVRKNF